MKKINDLQNDSIKVILESLKDYTTDSVVFFRTLFHKGDTGNIILRPYKPESLTTYTYLIDVMGNRERLSEEQYENYNYKFHSIIKKDSIFTVTMTK